MSGDLDHETHLRLLDAIERHIAAGHDRLLVDLSEVAFCDSTGLGALVQVHRETVARGGWLRLAAPNADLRRILAITNLDRLLPVYDSVYDAGRDVHRMVHSAR